MKKTYIKPTTETMLIRMENIIMSSTNGSISFNDDNSGSGFLNDDYADGEAMTHSRGLFQWE